MCLLAVENLVVNYPAPSGHVHAVDGAAFDLHRKETLALVGETGCGKSTVAHAILRLLPENTAVHGKIVYENRNLLALDEKEMVRLRGQEISLLMQNPALALNPVYTIGHQIIEPLVVHRKVKKNTATKEAIRLLTKLHFKGPSNAIRAYPFEMSGGMKQRVSIGISVVLNPKILIADEPTKALDDRLRKMVLEELTLVKEINASSMILITHDLHAAKAISDRIAVMYAGEILEMGPTQEFFQEPLHPYSQALLGSLPEKGFNPIPGVSPSMTNPPSGCKFHPRCPRQKVICSEARPEFVRFKNRDIKCVLYT